MLISLKDNNRSVFYEKNYFICISDNNAYNSGGIIDILDATAIQSYIAGNEGLDKIQLRNADVTGDGEINVSDATMIQKYIADML